MASPSRPPSGAGRQPARRTRFPRRRANVVDRRLARFLREPPSVRGAAGAIVAATALVVVGSGVLIRLVDPHEYSSIWVGMWWALQTATTVGYGDVTPARLGGRLVAVLVMLEGIAFLAIITAAITSTFITRATRELGAAQARDESSERRRVEARFDELSRKLDRIEAALGARPDP